MVSYMDIVTLLLTLMVLLFVYTRPVGTEQARVAVPHVEVQRAAVLLEAAIAATPAPAGDEPLAWDVWLPPRRLMSFVQAPIPELVALQFPVVAGEMASTAEASADAAQLTEERLPEPEDALDGVNDGPPPLPSVARAAVLTADPRDLAIVETKVAMADASAITGVRNDGLPAVSDAAAPPEVVAPVTAPGDTLVAAIQASELGRRIEVTRRQDAVNLEISDEILFDPGSAALTPGGETLLAELARLLAQQAMSISVEGHTDDTPIRNARFASNWELSTARATTVTRLLIADAVDPARLRAIGHADTRPRADNATSEGRARNRRVALVLQIPGASPGNASR